jgi:hypothetical protein
MMHQQGLGFYTRGAMTNIRGNPYPGMRGPQTHESFEAGWGREIERRAARFSADRNIAVDKEAITKSANDIRQRHNDIFGIKGRRDAKYGVRSTENEGLLRVAKQGGAFGTQKHEVEGNAAVHVSFSGLPVGARTKASADGMFKTVKLNRGKLPEPNDTQQA